ncbi:MAG: FG-GAP repeat protein, partial [Planctomycetota bacterium]
MASDGAAYDLFGWDVGLSGDRIVVGAYLNDANGLNSGAAYVFHREGDNWVEEAKLIGSNTVAGDKFGSDVLIEGDRVVVSSAYHDAGQNNIGAIYVFARQGTQWIEETQLYPYTGYNDYEHVYVKAMSGDYVVATTFGNHSEITIFHKTVSGWEIQARLDLLGGAIALRGTQMMIGNSQKSGPYSTADFGIAYLYERDDYRNEWSRRWSAQPASNVLGTGFGSDVAVEED